MENLQKKEYDEFCKIVYFVYNKYYRQYAYMKDDLISIGITAIWKASKMYSEDKGSKTTFYFKVCYRAINCYLSKWFHLRRKENAKEISIYIPTGEDDDCFLVDILEDKPFNFDSSFNLEYLKNVCNEIIDDIPKPTANGKLKYLSQQKAVKLYLKYFDFSAVGRELGITRECVRVFVNKFRDKLYKRLKDEGYING